MAGRHLKILPELSSTTSSTIGSITIAPAKNSSSSASSSSSSSAIGVFIKKTTTTSSYHHKHRHHHHSHNNIRLKHPHHRTISVEKSTPFAPSNNNKPMAASSARLHSLLTASDKKTKSKTTNNNIKDDYIVAIDELQDEIQHLKAANFRLRKRLISAEESDDVVVRSNSKPAVSESQNTSSTAAAERTVIFATHPPSSNNNNINAPKITTPKYHKNIPENVHLTSARSNKTFTLEQLNSHHNRDGAGTTALLLPYHPHAPNQPTSTVSRQLFSAGETITEEDVNSSTLSVSSSTSSSSSSSSIITNTTSYQLAARQQQQRKLPNVTIPPNATTNTRQQNYLNEYSTLLRPSSPPPFRSPKHQPTTLHLPTNHTTTIHMEAAASVSAQRDYATNSILPSVTHTATTAMAKASIHEQHNGDYLMNNNKVVVEKLPHVADARPKRNNGTHADFAWSSASNSSFTDKNQFFTRKLDNQFRLNRQEEMQLDELHNKAIQQATHLRTRSNNNDHQRLVTSARQTTQTISRTTKHAAMLNVPVTSAQTSSRTSSVVDDDSSMDNF